MKSIFKSDKNGIFQGQYLNYLDVFLLGFAVGGFISGCFFGITGIFQII